MSERKLATIQVIESIAAIPNADKIVMCKILGWECVIKKDEFQIGDKVCYCEVDSVMPEKPEYEFLRERKFRIRTIKLRGQVSQGLVLPIPDKYKSKDVGFDMTEIMGITKYLTPSEREEIKDEERLIRKANKLKKFMMRYSWFRRIFLSNKGKKGFPFWVQKTDEERIQNFPHVLQQFADYECVVTEKIDCQSASFTGQMIPKYDGWLGKIIRSKKYQFVVCSRNLTTNDKNSLYWRIAKKYNIEKILKENPDLTIQGEQGDTKVQGNKYGISNIQLWVFNIVNHKTGYFYNFLEMINFCNKYGLQHVPYVCTCQLKSLGNDVNEIVEFSKGTSEINQSVFREGIVVRIVNNGQKLLSFKVINPDFLLKYEN